MDNLAVQAVGIVCICVLVLLQIHSVFAVYHDDSHSVRPVKGQTKLCRNLLDILIIYLISKKQVVQVVPGPFIILKVPYQKQIPRRKPPQTS